MTFAQVNIDEVLTPAFPRDIREYVRMLQSALLDVTAEDRECSTLNPNVIGAVDSCRQISKSIVTLSGMTEGNTLSSSGGVNFHVPCTEYGLAEVSHHALCHYLLDAFFGPARRDSRADVPS